MADALALAQKLIESDVKFATLAVMILIGSYYNIWVWGRELTARQADFDKRLAKAEEIATKWESIAIKATGLAQDGIGLAELRTKKQE